MLEQKILDIVKKKFKVKNPKLKDSPKNIKKWDSLGHLELIQAVNKNLKIHISFEDTNKIENISDLLKICKKYKK